MMPTTYTALTRLFDKDTAYELSDALEGVFPEPTAIGVTLIEDGSGQWEVGAYFIEAPDEAGLAALAASFQARPFAISEVPDTDWVAAVKRELTPIRAGRFFLYGEHDADKMPEGVEPLLIEAAMAFGTGHHGTTKGCLEALDALIEEGFAPRSVADIGCGTAVLAMAAARIWDVPVIASDIDEVATQTALANFAANGMGARAEVITCPGFEHERLAYAAPFSLIFANILMAPLISLAPDMGRNTASGGMVILSGILDRQAAPVLAAYQAEGFTEHARRSLDGWTTLTMVKPA